MAKAARRVSGFRKAGLHDAPSVERVEKRQGLQPKGNPQHIRGYQTKYLQKICLKDRFGRVVRIKIIPHAKLSAQGAAE